MQAAAFKQQIGVRGEWSVQAAMWWCASGYVVGWVAHVILVSSLVPIGLWFFYFFGFGIGFGIGIGLGGLGLGLGLDNYYY